MFIQIAEIRNRFPLIKIPNTDIQWYSVNSGVQVAGLKEAGNVTSGIFADKRSSFVTTLTFGTNYSFIVLIRIISNAINTKVRMINTFHNGAP